MIRQAHPGPKAPPYRDFDQKLADARAYQTREALPWTVLIDDLEGSVHQVYGGLADPSYLIDLDGRVAFYEMWTYAPTLHQAIEALLKRDGRGQVEGGLTRGMNPLPALADGWRGLRLGLPQSFFDLTLALPGSASLLWLGHRLRPVLAPVALRARPLPGPVRLGLKALAAVWLARLVRRVTDRGAPARAGRRRPNDRD